MALIVGNNYSSIGNNMLHNYHKQILVGDYDMTSKDSNSTHTGDIYITIYGDAEAVEDSQHAAEVPPYSIKEITNIIMDFYQFLTALHFSSDDLLIPPESGWDHIRDSDESTFVKSPLVLSVLKHLPFFKDTTLAQIHEQSHIRDYSNITVEDLASGYGDEYFEDILKSMYPDENDNEPEARNTITIKDILVIAYGYESYGRNIVLVPKTGEVIEDVIRVDPLGPFDMQQYFNDLKQKYRTLQLIGGVCKTTIATDDIPETTTVWNQNNLTPSLEYLAPTDSHIQYLRQILRSHGWPNSFRREAAMNEVAKWTKEAEERDEWTWEDDFRRKCR